MAEKWWSVDGLYAVIGTIKIKSILVERHTDANVWVDGRRRSRITEYHRIFPYLEDAKRFAIERLEHRIKETESRLQMLHGALDEINEMRE